MSPASNFGGFVGLSLPASRNFLDHYFVSVHSKLEADALLFNRKLPHAGLVGSENEHAIAEVLRDFLPVQFGVAENAIVIDRLGHASKQTDIVIYDARQPKFFRKVFPIETVYAVVEVKTSMGSSEAKLALDNLRALNALDFRPALTPYWQTRTNEQKLHHDPPCCFVFSYRTDCQSFETFAKWFPWSFLHEGTKLREHAPVYPEIRTLTIAALDQGLITMASTNGYVQRFMAVAGDGQVERVLHSSIGGKPVPIDPAKSLFFFLNRLWSDLEQHQLHPGFDVRSYMSEVLASMIRVEPEQVEKAE